MLYITTALKSEAQAFVDKYKLKKDRLNNFLLYVSSKITLIVSGVGVDNMTLATQTLINQFDIDDEDIFVNIGICGADSSFEIGELLNITTVIYNSSKYYLNEEDKQESIVCVDTPITHNDFNIVDMESFGFYDAVSHSPAIKQRYILKVVSDHFEPSIITKERTKSLIFNLIDAINSIIYRRVSF